MATLEIKGALSLSEGKEAKFVHWGVELLSPERRVY